MKMICRRAVCFIFCAAFLCGCSSPQTARTAEPAKPAETADVRSDKIPFDFAAVGAATAVPALVEKYGAVSVNYLMHFEDEDYRQSITFFGNENGSISYIQTSGDNDDTEYFDGLCDYWTQYTEDGTVGYADLPVGGADLGISYENYIFDHSDADSLTVTGMTRTDDGGAIVEAQEEYADTVEVEGDGEGETSVSERIFVYDYIFRVNPSNEMTEIKMSCIDKESGKTDSTLEMKVTFGGEKPAVPQFMNDTFTINAVFIGSEDETSYDFAVPSGFLPYIMTPEDGDYIISRNREMTDTISSTASITESAVLYIRRADAAQGVVN